MYWYFTIIIIKQVTNQVTTPYNPCTADNIAKGLIFFAYPGDDTKFIECDRNGQPQTLSCPSRLVYSSARQSCLLPTSQTAGSGSGVVTNPPVTSSPVVNPGKFVRPRCFKITNPYVGKPHYRCFLLAVTSFTNYKSL